MPRRADIPWLVSAVLAMASLCSAQDVGPTPPPSSPDAALEAYLARLGLKELLADHLASRLRQSAPEERRALGEQLARIYVDVLSQAGTAEQRKPWEERGRELLQLVPEGDTHELRISLAKAVYVHAEDIVERHRLRLATPDEVADAERTLRGARAEFADVAAKSHARVETLERKEQAGAETEQLAEQIMEARRLRSLAFYYSGWTDYYLAYLSGSEKLALDASRSFGWLVNARGGLPASLEKLQPDLLKYDHIARAAIGCALCASLRNADTEAVRWLDAVAESPKAPRAVKDQLLARRISVFACAKRWADLDREIRRARKAERSGRADAVVSEPLPVVPARLLAIVTLEADRKTAGDLLERLAQIGLADLVSRGETAQVLDLVQKYGTAPIGDTGFIVHYVRGIQAYERARSMHRESGGNADEPAAADAVVNQYRQSASLLDAAIAQSDAASFASERARAGMVVGQALFYAGDFTRASDRFLESASSSPRKEQGEEPMWLAIAALDRAAKDGESGAAKRRDQTATLFLQSYPDSPRAAQLLVSLGNAGLLGDEETIKILLSVPKGAPTYDGARRQASRLLYSIYRGAPADQRDFAAARFVASAEELLAEDRRVALEQSGPAAREAGERVVTRVRQILDAVLTSQSPDPARAQAALDVLDSVATHSGIDLAPHQPELLYRRIQILLARGQTDEAIALGDQLRDAASTAAGRQYADSADRLLYRSALAAWKRAEAGDAASRAAVIRFGTRIIATLGSTPAALVDAATLSLHATVADAAAQAWDASKDESMRDLAIRLDRAILAAQPRSEPPLRRLSRLAEAAGDSTTALECWRMLVSSMETGTPAWFEGRCNVFRLLAAVDKPAARIEMQRHKLLFPSFGPEPWGSKLKEVDLLLGPPPADASPPVPAGAGTGPGSPKPPGREGGKP